MEKLTLLYTLICLFGSILLSSCLVKDRRTWIFGVFFFIMFIGFGVLTYAEIFDPELKDSTWRAFIYRGIVTVGIITVVVYRSFVWWRDKWRNSR